MTVLIEIPKTNLLLKQMRKSRYLSVKQGSERSGMSEDAIYYLEKESNPYPKLETLKKMAEAYDYEIKICVTDKRKNTLLDVMQEVNGKPAELQTESAEITSQAPVQTSNNSAA